MPQIIILSGIPCSGKSTWAKGQGFSIVSRDEIRLTLFGRKYKQNGRDEKKINEFFDRKLRGLLRNGDNIIIDNTNVRREYIQKILNIIPFNYSVEIKKFEVSLPKAYYRNVVRYITTGKWIPFKVINKMYKDFNKIKNEEIFQ